MVGPRQSALSAVAVPIASTLANVVSYALLLAAAHLMSQSDYGKLSSLLGLLLVATIPMLALQTVAARRTASGEEREGIVRGTTVIALGSTAVLLVLSPAIAAFLHLSSVLGVLLVAATIPATAVLGTAMGVAQGRRHFGRLALLIAFSTGGRSLGGLIGLLVRHTTVATLVGVLAGTGAAAAGVALERGGLSRHRTAMRERPGPGVVTETLHAAHAHGSFLLLTSLDVLLARHVLVASAAGVYAVGAVVTRAALWLPQSIVALMFASLAEVEKHHETARRASALVAGMGAVVVAGSAVFGPLLVTVVGGAKYHSLDDVVWLFALLGALLAMLQLAVLAGLARRQARRAALLWLTIAADVVVVLVTSGHATPTRVVVALVAVSSAAAVAAVFLTIRQPVVPEGQAAGV